MNSSYIHYYQRYSFDPKGFFVWVGPLASREASKAGSCGPTTQELRHQIYVKNPSFGQNFDKYVFPHQLIILYV